MFNKTRKKLKDYQTLRKYAARLAAMRVTCSQTATRLCETDHKSRVEAVGECCMTILDKVEELRRTRKVMDRTLVFMISDQKVQDPTGKKGHQYQVSYQVTVDEPALTEEQIQEEVKELAEKLHMETEELFANDKVSRSGESEGMAEEESGKV